MIKKICVYSSSSDAVAAEFFTEAGRLGALLGQRGYTLVFGAGRIGLMGRLAKSVHEYGGQVIGVIPKYLNQFGITYEHCDRLIVSADMRERKAAMEKEADAFIAIPGGFGTLEEILEVITLKQLQLHCKPIVFINTLNFYDHLLRQFQHLFAESFSKNIHKKLYTVVTDAVQALDFIENYQPPVLEQKWF